MLIDDINRQLTKHFQLEEMLHEGSTEGLTSVILQNLLKTAQMLEYVRTLCGNRPIRVNSAFRTPEHNREVGGAPNSQHLYGRAADIVVEGLSPHEVQALLKDWPGGLGCYTTWTHIDWWFQSTASPKRRWIGP